DDIRTNEINNGSNEKTNEIRNGNNEINGSNENEIDGGSNEKINEININSRKRKVIDISDDENPNVHAYIIILHTPGIANKSDLIISTVDDKLISIDGNFCGKVAPGRKIISLLPIRPFEVEIELPS
ncbi:1640_t:CDS:2, partial [Acaulospora colombiana]